MRHVLLRSCSELHFCFEDKGKVCHPGPIATSNLLPPPSYKSFREINKNTFPFQKPFVCEEIWILERLQSQVCTDQICTWEGKQGVTLRATSQHLNISLSELFPAFQHPNFFSISTCWRAILTLWSPVTTFLTCCDVWLFGWNFTLIFDNI